MGWGKKKKKTNKQTKKQNTNTKHFKSNKVPK